MVRCAYRPCTTTSGCGKSLFTFPEDAERANFWLVACNRKDLVDKIGKGLYKVHFLCEDHFEQQYVIQGVVRKHLVHKAIPTIFKVPDIILSEIQSRIQSEIPAKKFRRTNDTQTSDSTMDKQSDNAHDNEFSAMFSEQGKMDYTLEEKYKIVVWHHRGIPEKQMRSLFSEMFPNRPTPTRSVVQRLVNNLRTHGCLLGKMHKEACTNATKSDDTSESSEESEYEAVDSSLLEADAPTQTEWNKQSRGGKLTQNNINMHRKEQSGERKFAELEKAEISLPDVLKFIEENYPKNDEITLIKKQLLTLGNNTKRMRPAKAVSEVVTKEIEDHTTSLEFADSTTKNSHSIADLFLIETEEIKIEPVEILDPAKVKTEKDDPEFEDPQRQQIHFTSENISEDIFLVKKEEIKTECFDRIEMTSEVGRKGLIIGSQGREIIFKVRDFMKMESEQGLSIPLVNYRERTLAATGVSRSTYQRISKEAEANPGTSFSSPKKKGPKRCKKLDNISEEQIRKITTIVHDLYVTEKSRPTLKSILQKINDRQIMTEQIGISSLGKLLKRIGFRWQKTWQKTQDI